VSNLIKIVLFTSPVLFLFFWYVVSQQRKLDVEIQKEDAVFERDWNEFSSEFEFSKNKKYQQRAEQAEKKLSEIEQMEKEKQKKAEEFEKELDRALKEEEPALEKKLQKVKP
jgi:biopolymer transport protein ExbB/TolQ